MFNLKVYKEIVQLLLSKNMKPSTNWNGPLTDKTLLLRHDVDFSLDYAYELACTEDEMGIKSSYFIMLTSNMYNLYSPHNQDLVNKIRGLGHKISLHFDPTIYEHEDEYKKEIFIFEQLFDLNVDIISIHRPRKFLKNNDKLVNGISQTYQNKFFKEMVYISDSGGRDIRGLVCDYVEKDKKLGLHLLTHPVWWMGNGNCPTSTLNNFKDGHLNFIKSEIQKNCKTYRS